MKAGPESKSNLNLKPSRLSWADWARAIGIFLVVYGHSQAVPAPLFKIIYSFHIPLFFILAGYFISDGKINQSFKSYSSSVFRALLPPYLLFAIFGYITWVFVLRHFGNDAKEKVSLLTPLLAIPYGSGSAQYLLRPVICWFFPCLMSAKLVHWIVYNKLNSEPKRISVILALVAFGWWAGSLHKFILPWELEDACIAVAFLHVGMIARKKQWIGRAKNYFSITVALVLGVVLALNNSEVDCRLSKYGNLFLFFPAAISLATFLVGFCARLPLSKVVEKISENTIIIFPIHIFVYSGLAAFYVYILKLPLVVREAPWLGICSALVNILIIFMILPYFKRWVPIAYGLPSKGGRNFAGPNPGNQK